MVPKFLVLLAVAACTSRDARVPGPTAAAEARPNIVLVMADDQGWGDVAARGHPHLKTPTLDTLYRKAVRFERFYAQSPVCSPTRASVLTGRHGARCGVTTANVGHLPADDSLAIRLGRSGYRCGHFGKWHLGTLTKTLRESNRGGPRGAKHFAPPWERGFDVSFSTEAKVPTFDPMRTPPRFAGGVGKKQVGTPYGTHYWSQAGAGPAERVPESALGGDDSALIVERACRFIEDCARAEQPFFTVVWFHAPHLPVVAGPADLALYEHLEVDQQTLHYFGCLTALDRALGRLRATLRDAGVARDTMLWYCSDNGPEGASDRAPGRTGGLRGRKRSLYEGGIRVPAFLEWPARYPRARTIAAPCSTSDLMPTILTAVGLEASGRELDGIDLGPLLRGEVSIRERAIAFTHGKSSALIGDRYKLVVRGDRRELYDLDDDPGETRDLSAAEPERVEAKSAILEDWKAGLTR